MTLIEKGIANVVKKIWLPALLVAVLCQCGYRLSGTGSNIPQHIQKVAIPPFQNNTAKAELGEILTARVKDQFLARGSFAIQDQREGSDAELVGEIINFTSRPIGFNADGRASDIIVQIVASVRFSDRINEKVLYSNRNYSFRQTYQIGDDSGSYYDQEIEAIELGADDFARTLVSAILEGF